MVRSQQFQTDRSDALRQQLIEMPKAVKNRERAQGQRSHFQHLRPQDSSASTRKRLGLRVGAGALAGGLVLGALALALTPEDRSEDASRIIKSLTKAQQEVDKLPAGALPVLASTGIDPSQTRLLGHSATIRYYGAPAPEQITNGATAGKTICMIPVDARGESKSLGCTLLKSFESYGLKIETPDRTEAGWLVVPAAAESSLESVKNEAGWSRQAPNFLVRNNN